MNTKQFFTTLLSLNLMYFKKNILQDYYYFAQNHTIIVKIHSSCDLNITLHNH